MSLPSWLDLVYFACKVKDLELNHSQKFKDFAFNVYTWEMMVSLRTTSTHTLHIVCLTPRQLFKSKGG